MRSFKMLSALVLFMCLSVTISSKAASPDKNSNYIEESSIASTSTESSTEQKQGQSLGTFMLTGYCNCTKCCSGGYALTYSGTVPKANHTISADINIFPIGTKLSINGIIYTVEDIGSGVSDHVLDIYYDTHEEALNAGVSYAEVFSVPS